MKSFISIILSTLLLVSCASDGNSTPTNASKEDKDTKKNITVWAWDKNFNIPIMEEAAKRYNQTNPDVKINIVDFSLDDVNTKLKTGLSANTISNLPDITLMQDYDAQSYLKNYDGFFADLTDKIVPSDFAQYKVKAYTHNNKLYAVPFDSGVTGLFYRSDYFEKAGIKDEDLQNITWRQFIDIGKKVAEANPGVYILGDNKNEGSGQVRMAMQSAGTWYFDENGNPTIANNEAAKEIIENFKLLDETGFWKQTNNWDEWVSGANNGEIAAYVTGAWFMPSIMAASDQSGKWKIAPTLRLDNTPSENATNLGGSSWVVIDKNNENTQIAIDFLAKTFGADKDFYQTILKNNGAIGTYLPAQTGEAYQEKSQFFSGQQIYLMFSDWMKKIPEVNYGEYTSLSDKMLHSKMPDLYKGKSPSEILKEVEQLITNQIN